ncbi:hypothetical protein [Reyranella sp.]|uniref:hypothetical protein n=1 Tax=Reyranella sp. TaxID=1929291 RepID=UPI00272F1EB6|nr:hypothetical protein [Reyranella sp.]MDP2377787.1 hypothetical protein [Reyranella sp.]
MEKRKFEFEQVDILLREADIEGEVGIEIRFTDTVYLRILAQTDANSLYRAHGPRMLREINRRANAGASPEEMDKEWAKFHAACIVIGWRGVNAPGTPATDTEDARSGEPVPFSKAAYIEWACIHRRVRFLLQEYSRDETNFRRDHAEATSDQLKN